MFTCRILIWCIWIWKRETQYFFTRSWFTVQGEIKLIITGSPSLYILRAPQLTALRLKARFRCVSPHFSIFRNVFLGGSCRRNRTNGCEKNGNEDQIRRYLENESAYGAGKSRVVVKYMLYKFAFNTKYCTSQPIYNFYVPCPSNILKNQIFSGAFVHK